MSFAYQPRNEIGRIELAQEVIRSAGFQSRMSLALVNNVDHAIRTLVRSPLIGNPLVIREYGLLLKQCGLVDDNSMLTQQGKEAKRRIMELLV